MLLTQEAENTVDFYAPMYTTFPKHPGASGRNLGKEAKKREFRDIFRHGDHGDVYPNTQEISSSSLHEIPLQ